MNDADFENQVRSLVKEVAEATPVGQARLTAVTRSGPGARTYRRRPALAAGMVGIAACTAAGLLFVATRDRPSEQLPSLSGTARVGEPPPEPVTSIAVSSPDTSTSDSIAPSSIVDSTRAAPTTSTSIEVAPSSSDVTELPPATIDYVVQYGDYLLSIAAEHNTTMEEIVTANGWSDGIHHTIRVGESIKVPNTP